MNISFIIPVLNADKFIRQCIESILSEMLESDEIIVVDNGSTDNTVNIINSFDGIRLLIQPHLTVSALRNRGAAAAINPLLAFIDADCVLCDGWRQEAIYVFKDEAVHATGSLYDIPENAEWIEKAWFSQKVTKKGRAKYINSGNLIVIKDVFNKLNGFDEGLISDEDCEFGARLNRAGYYMLEAPEIRVVHFGNPKSLKAFYLKEKWHATSVLASQSLRTLDRTTIMTIFFGVTILLSLLCVGTSLWMKINLLWAMLSITFIPLLTAVYRGYQFKKFRYVPELTLLWGIFYLVRIRNMVTHFSK